MPVGLYLTADALTGITMQGSWFVGLRNGAFDFTRIGVVFVFAILLKLASVFCFTGWMTRILLRFVETGKVDLISSFQSIKWWFPRTLAFVVLGWLPVGVLLGAIFLPAFGGGGSWTLMWAMSPFIFIIAVFALIWNLATVLVLPFILSVGVNLKTAIAEGIKFSWANKKKTILPVLLLMVVAGWISIIAVTFNEREVETGGIEDFSEYYSTRRISRFNYSTNFVWIGNYPDTSKWHSDLLKTVKEEPLSPVDFRITLLMLFLSLVVNLKLIQEVWGAKDDESLAADDLSSLKRIYFNRAAAVGLILLFVPFEIITQNIHPRNWPSLSWATIPETPQVIKGENFLVKQTLFEIGQGNTVSFLPKEDKNKFEVRGIHDIAAGNLDGEPGQDIVLATGIGTLILNPNGEIKKETPYQIEKKGEDNLNVHFVYQKIVDIDNDGICEFVNYDGYAPEGIYDIKGNLILKFEEKPSEDNLTVLAVGDLDGNGIYELFSISNGEIKPFQLKDAGSQNTIFAQNATVFDETGNGDLKLLTNPGQAVIKDGSFKELKKARKPTFQNGYLFEKNSEPLSIVFNKNLLGLFDLDGKLKAKYEAPLSEEKNGYFEEKDNIFGGPLKVNIFQSEALRIKLLKDKPEFLAVMAYQSRESGNFTRMFYIYDSAGELVYQELFNDIRTIMNLMPSENNDGTESLLIVSGDKVWKYTTQ